MTDIESNLSGTEAASDEVVETQKSEKLSIVGIGASAGGLSPLRAFFAALPGDTGMTFVVVVHLSPDFESMLADLLQGYTQMPVTQVHDKVAMEPNHVYIIPPGKRLIVTDGHLDLEDLRMPLGRRLQIDVFFRSLAEEHGDGAAIILSGTGSDGAVGMRAIKEKGGLLLVQAPAEAEYDGMPRSAIATGLVDIIAPVAELAAELVAAKNTKEALALPQDPGKLSQGEQHTLFQILTQLHLRTGHDFGGYREATILRRITRRMQLSRVNEITDYLQRLRQDSEEIDALYRDVLIHVTEFFRDREAWATLAREVVPKLFDGRGGDETIRVWTVGCATGEEAYSIAIVLLEFASRLDNPPSIQIFASDLGKVALDYARKGIYPEAIAADVSQERLERFFIHDNSHFQVRPEVRDLVLFTPHNLLQDAPFSKLDLIICRNVFIYLQRTIQKRVFESLHYALRPMGFLFLGSAETTDGSAELFETVDKRHRLYKRSQLQRNRTILPTLPVLARSVYSIFDIERAQQSQPSPAEQHHLLLEERGLPSLLVDEHFHVLHYSESVWRYLYHPAGPPTPDLLRLLRPELQSEVRLALHEAFNQRRNTATRSVPVKLNGSTHVVTVMVRPSPKIGRALVLFWEDDESARLIPGEVGNEAGDDRAAKFEEQLLNSEQQLQNAKEEYESSVEELRAANEELQSTNEEYRSTLEELETSKEELQSLNEELQSVNQEMKVRMDELVTANSDLQNLFAATEIATLFLDHDLCVKRFTPRAAELFNLMPADRGRPIGHLRSKLVYSTLESDVRKVLSNLAPLEREIQAEDNRWFLVGVRPYRTVEDKIDGVVITCVDISKSKQNEEALRESNEQLRDARDLFSSLFHSSPIPTALTRRSDRVILDVNSAYLSFFDLPRDAFVGKTMTQLDQWNRTDDVDIPGLYEQREDGTRNFEITTSHPTGETKTALVSLQLVEQDRIEAVISSFVDITELKRVQETLKLSEERLRLTLESITDYAFVTVDNNGKIVDWRAGAEQVFGYSRDEALGQPIALIFTPEDRAAEVPEEEMENARTKGRAVDERWHLRKDGTTFFMGGVMVPLQLDGNLGFIKIGHDLTARRQMEEALESQVKVRTEQVRSLVVELTMSEQEERRRISAILHDELQQRLFSLNVQLAILRQILENQSQEEGKQVIVELGESVSELVQVTRDLSVNLSPPILHDEGLYEALRWLTSYMSKQHNLNVEITTAGKLPILNEDLRVLVFQVVRELLFNIVKHAGVANATISLSTMNEDTRIEVLDEGHGFDMTSQFSQSSQGLLRTKQRIELVGGSIQIISSPGEGTRAIIQVPQFNRLSQ